MKRHAPRFLGGIALALALSTPLLVVQSAKATPLGGNSSVNARPDVVPALQQWEGGTGSFELREHSRIVLAKKQVKELDDQGTRLSAEIEQVTGRKLDVSPRTPQDGDIVLSIDPALAGPGGARFAEEGYTLTVTDHNVTIAAPTATGVYYGTRSLLQILLLDDGRDSLPVGRAVDWPNYKVRGFMLDVGRRFFTADYIRDYLRLMGWFKLNQLQLHLNDNGFKGNKPSWSQVQAGFRLKTDNPELAGLASADGAYDRADWDSFEDTAAANGVTIIPEIDAPAHSLAFIRFRPSLGLNNGESDHLDLSKPETTAFMKSVFDEFVPWFRSPDVHFGADEYTVDKPRYKTYFNEMAAHIRALGKHPRAWGSLSIMAANTDGYDRDVTMNSWNNGWYGPQAIKRDGYSFINTNDALLYIVPFAGYYHGRGLDGKYLYDQWEPHVFPGGQSVAPGDPRLLGAMSAVWNDLTEATYTELDVHGLVEPTFGVLAQKMWSGATSGVPYSAFLGTVRKLGVGPGLTKVSTTLTASASGEVSLGKQATASAGEAAAAFDGVRTTKWASGPGDKAWLQVDLGKPFAISEVELDWAPAYGRDYDILVSRDGEKWSTVARRTGREAAGADTLAFEPVTARHVRLVGTQAGRQHDGYALWSMRVLEVPDLALHRPTTASSSEVPSLAPENATDGDPRTRWASAYRDGEWIQVDLGSPQTVQRVLLDWETASGRDYDIQVSDDAASWKTVLSVRDRPEGARVDELTFAPVTARYVRMQGVKRTSSFGYSLHSFEIRSLSPQPDPA